MPKLIDCFIFFNEIAMLKYRLHLLYQYVDHFVIIEASKTHTQKEKPSYFEQYKDLFKEYLDKVIYLYIDDLPDSPIAMDLEIHQRNAIDRGIEQLTLDPTDILLISDLDELPDPKKLVMMKKTGIKTLFSLEQKVYYFNPTIYQAEFWAPAKALPYSIYCSIFNRSPNTIRGAPIDKIMKCAGWHFSFFGSTEFIMTKLKNYSHQEHNVSSIVNKSFIEECIKHRKDMFGRPFQYTYIPLEENHDLPPDIHLLLQWLEEYA
jgi:beta-1,4-mannosyl-glycoprotein beta-1,4-N-acetylglucosaminyltransferase